MAGWLGRLFGRMSATRARPPEPGRPPAAVVVAEEEGFPWGMVGTCPVGGLRSIGFSPGTDLLLVVSEQGRIVLDGATSVQVARDPMRYLVGQERCEALGIGTLKGQVIAVAGIYGGVLPAVTPDGWSREIERVGGADAAVLLVEPPGSEAGSWRIAPADGVLVTGFSDTGASFVVATASEVTIWGRPRPL